MDYIKKIGNNMCWQRCGEHRTLLHNANCSINGSNLYRKLYQVSLKNKSGNTICSSYTIAFTQKKSLIQKDICIPTFIMALGSLDLKYRINQNVHG